MSAMTPADWGQDLSGGADVQLDFVFPAMPCCIRWTNDGLDHNQMMSLRVWGTAEEDAAMLQFSVGDMPTTSQVMPILVTENWSASDSEPLFCAEHPDEPTEIDTLHPSDCCVPYVQTQMRAYIMSEGTGSNCTIYNAEFGSRHDVAYPLAYDLAEIANYSDGAFYGADKAAASWMLKRLVVNAYNIIVHSAAYRINVAIADRWRR